MLEVIKAWWKESNLTLFTIVWTLMFIGFVIFDRMFFGYFKPEVFWFFGGGYTIAYGASIISYIIENRGGRRS